MLGGHGRVVVRLNGKLQRTVRIDGDRLYTLVTQRQAKDGLLELQLHSGPCRPTRLRSARARAARRGLALGPAVAAFTVPQEPRQLRCEGITGGKLLLVVQQLGTLLELLDVRGGLLVRRRPPR